MRVITLFLSAPLFLPFTPSQPTLLISVLTRASKSLSPSRAGSSASSFHALDNVLIYNTVTATHTHVRARIFSLGSPRHSFSGLNNAKSHKIFAGIILKYNILSLLSRFLGALFAAARAMCFIYTHALHAVRMYIYVCLLSQRRALICHKRDKGHSRFCSFSLALI